MGSRLTLGDGRPRLPSRDADDRLALWSISWRTGCPQRRLSANIPNLRPKIYARPCNTPLRWLTKRSAFSRVPPREMSGRHGRVAHDSGASPRRRFNSVSLVTKCSPPPPMRAASVSERGRLQRTIYPPGPPSTHPRREP